MVVKVNHRSLSRLVRSWYISRNPTEPHLSYQDGPSILYVRKGVIFQRLMPISLHMVCHRKYLRIKMPGGRDGMPQSPSGKTTLGGSNSSFNSCLNLASHDHDGSGGSNEQDTICCEAGCEPAFEYNNS